MKNIFTLFLLLILSVRLIGQPVTLPFEHKLRIEYERNLVKDGKAWHAIYPMRIETGEKDPAYPGLYRGAPGAMNKSFRAWLNRKVFYEPLIIVDTMGLKLKIDPMIYFETGNEISSGKDQPVAEGQPGTGWKDGRKTWVNTRGIRVDGSIGKQVAFHSAFFESQAVFPTWIDAQSRNLNVVPGQAMYKSFKSGGFDYAFAEGHVSYSPSHYFNFRLGHGKNFIGDGYRSLLLSDVAFNYPYLAISTQVWNIQYINIYSQLQDIRAPKGGYWHPWQKKYTTTHYLSWNVLPWLNMGLFESIVWQASDSTGVRGFDVNYLNPIIFYRPVEFSLGSPDNALLGGSLRFRVRKSNFIYCQLMLDEFKLEHVLKGDGWWANKHGFQVGIKSYDPFKISNLFIQAEYNHVRPYTYAHNSPVQNYGHYNQPLAHPQGANFREALLILNKRFHRWQFELKSVYVVYGADTSGLSFGHDIYRSYYDFVNEFGNTIGQGLKTTLWQHDISAGWIVNPATNLMFNAGLTIRQQNNELADNQTVHFWFGIRSSVFNRYYDF